MTAIQTLLQSLVSVVKPAPVLDINKIADNDWEVLRVTPETFEKAELIADTLCLAVEITYIGDDGEDKILSVVIREIRKFDKNTYLMKVEYGNGNIELLSSDRTEEIFAGAFGKLYDTDRDEYGSPLEEILFESGKKIDEAIGINPTKGEVPRVAPTIQTFFHMFEVFEDQNYYALRLKLHLLKFLVKSAGSAKSDAEMNVIRQFIKSDSSVQPSDQEALIEYADYSLVTPAVLKETVDKIHLVPNADLKATLATAKTLIETGGAITPQEQDLYDQLLKAL